MRLHTLGTLVLALASALGCGSKRKPPKGALPPLVAPSWLIDVPSRDFADAKAAVPLGAVRPRPLLIALGGEIDRPEWRCGSYRGVTGNRSFILCPSRTPRGSATPSMPTTEATARALRAEIAALKARFGAHLARGSVVLAALGPSVEHALALALEEPSFFSRLVLVNGSLSRLDGAFATRYGQMGGERVLVVCSRGGCGADPDLKVRSLRPAGVDARLTRPERGEGLDAETVRSIGEQWSWLVGSDARWR